ncbi:MAG: hypothetical protein EOO44_14300 [Flavobacterium sp.]|nr:MAG: hypothetical protein EOO44_14300 [Flavobacterium sp.]
MQYSTAFERKLNTADYKLALNFIGDFLTKKTADHITIEENRLIFKCDFFKMGWSTNILVQTEKGIFTIVEKENKSLLIYKFFMYQLFGGAFVMSLIIAFVSTEIWMGIFCFLWLGGMNWVIALFRHRSMLNEIVVEIDTLVKAKDS